MAERIFGTDGIRGIAGEGVLSSSSVKRLGQIIGAALRSESGEAGRACVGRDTRPSGETLSGALQEGLTDAGVDVLDVGILPTPGVAHLTSAYECGIGIVLTASHNPAEYNGLKILGPQGEKIPDELEDEIHRRYQGKELSVPGAHSKGKVGVARDGADRYVSYLLGSWEGGRLEGMRVALDCADGAAGEVAPRVLKELGAEVHVTRADMEGEGINLGCGALHPESVRGFSKEVQAEVGLSFDGDGDRLLLVDEAWEIRDGDDVLAICARDLDRREALAGGAVVGTVMSNVGLERSLEEIGARLLRARVGDRYVLGEMKKGGYTLGGEPSGHVIFLPLSTAGDGILTALQVLRLIRESGTPLSVLSRCMTRAPQVVLNFPIQGKRPLEEMDEVQKEIRSAEDRLGPEGRVLVRYSGTEPLVRVMVEGPQGEAIEEMARAIGKAFPPSDRR